MNPHEEARLRALLDDTVADIEPSPSLDRIQARTKVVPIRRRPWLLGASAAAVATAATVTAIAVTANGPGTTQSDPGFAGDPGSVATSPATDAPSPGEGDPLPVDAAVPVYYVGETGQGPRLYREFHAGTGAAMLPTALSDAVTGTPLDPDYFSPWPAGTTVSVAETDPGADVINVDVTSPGGTSLHGRPAGMSAELAGLAVQQLVYTAQAATQATTPVQLLLDGGRTDQLLGVPVSEPLARADATSTLAQVWIIGPAEGERVRTGFTVSGIGAFFEANVTWELRQGERVVQSGFSTAEECCRMAPYSFTVDAPPGDYLLVVRDEDASGGSEGAPPFEDTKNITVTG